MSVRIIFVLLGLALASGGGLMYLLAQQPVIMVNSGIIDQPRHLVTAQMLAFTGSKTDKQAPEFQTKSTNGDEVKIAPSTGTRPQFVYFVMDGCPCSVDAEPLFHDLFTRFGSKIDFISVTDADQTKAKRWAGQMGVMYSVIPDPKKNIVHGFGATNSVFSALVLPNGKISKMWPGYSKDILEEMNQRMSTLTAVAEKPFDTKWAPIKRASGCNF